MAPAAAAVARSLAGEHPLLLQRRLGLRRDKTAWLLLHQLRRAIVNAAREPLHDEVEVGGFRPLS